MSAATPPPVDDRARLFAEQRDVETTLATRQEVARRTRRSLLTGAAALSAGAFAWRWLQTRPDDGNIPWPLRRGFELNEAVWETLYDPGRLAPEFDLADAEDIRVNGTIGLRTPIDLAAWRLLVGDPVGNLVAELALEEIQALPTVEQVTEHKCIEGWSNVVHWTGTPAAELVTRWPRLLADTRYASIATPDLEYYVGLDLDTLLHPQTLLAWGINGEPLPLEHGAPLRLVTPLHYGIKAIKRIGSIQFTVERPVDYWAQRGYDWDSSH